MAGFCPSADGDQDLFVRILLRAIRVLGKMRDRIVRICIRPGIGGLDGKPAVPGNNFPEGMVDTVDPVPGQAVHILPAVGIDIPVRKINCHTGLLSDCFSRYAAQKKHAGQNSSQEHTYQFTHFKPSG